MSQGEPVIRMDLDYSVRKRLRMAVLERVADTLVSVRINRFFCRYRDVRMGRPWAVPPLYGRMVPSQMNRGE